MLAIGVQDVGTETGFELGLLAQTAITPHVSLFYEELLHWSDDSVEVYSIAPPPGLEGLTFAEAVADLHARSVVVDDMNPVVLVALAAAGDGRRLEVNPCGAERKIRADDSLITVAYKAPDQALLQSSVAPSQADVGAQAIAVECRSMTGMAAIKDAHPHVVVLNWNADGPKLLEQLRAARSVASATTPVVIVTDQPIRFGAGDVFEDVTVLPMAPYDSSALERVSIESARAVVILADHTRPNPDSHTLLLALRVKRMLEPMDPFVRPNISAEVVDPRQVNVLRGAEVDEPVCARELLYRVFAQAVENPAFVPLFQELLRVSDDTNEVYLVAPPPELTAQPHTFAEAVRWLARRRDGDNPSLLLGVRKPDGKLLVNPRGPDLKTSVALRDQLLVMQYRLER